MTKLVLEDELLDAQVLRAVGSAGYGGADVGECLAAARSVSKTDLASWYEAWKGLADGVRGLAESEERAGRRESARGAYLRASTYYRTAGVMLMGSPPDDRFVESISRQTEMFRCAALLMDQPPEMVAIPFEDTTLPGYFFVGAGDDRPRATVILTGGYDGTAEELYFANGAAALDRGYNVLAFDGPGQGSALVYQGLHLRPDWETVIAAVVDFATSRPEVDPDRLALIGLSLGAHLAPRAASSEHRLAVVVADCGSYDLQASFLGRLPPPLAKRYLSGSRSARVLLRIVLKRVMAKPTAGWGLRRGLLVHGASNPLAYLDQLHDYTLVGRAEHITAPTWVCRAEGDDISASAPDLVAALTCPKQLVEFTAAEGADDHCEQGARALYHARSFGWLDELLHPTEAQMTGR